MIIRLQSFWDDGIIIIYIYKERSAHENRKNYGMRNRAKNL